MEIYYTYILLHYSQICYQKCHLDMMMSIIETILSFVPTNCSLWQSIQERFYLPPAQTSILCVGETISQKRLLPRGGPYIIYRCINYSYRVDSGLACIPARCSCSCNASAVGRFETADIAETPLRRCGPPFKRHVPFACRLQLRGPFTAADFPYLSINVLKARFD